MEPPKLKKILIFSRLEITNLGDPLLAFCCKYMIEKVAKEAEIPVKTKLVDIFAQEEEIKKEIADQDIVVFPGGGLNSQRVNHVVISILDLLEKQRDTSVFFNAIGILRIKPNEKTEELLREIFNRKQVKQVTTRGDLARLRSHILVNPPVNKYPSRWILDPGMWAGEAYGVQKHASSQKIGIGVIRPEIYQENDKDKEFSIEDIDTMYVNIIHELEARGYEWELFSNGMVRDQNYARRLLEILQREKEGHLKARPKTCERLVRNIASYRAVIAARMHANIIATSLDIPTVGLVWNDKMNLFAATIGCPERYVPADRMQDAAYIVDRMEESIERGYNQKFIAKQKRKTLRTIRNIVRE